MPTTPQETRVEIDDDNDGRIDRIEFDTDRDGTPERIAHLNADGRWERVDRDLDDDGTIDRINHYTFDDDGNRSVTRIEFDDDDDGTIDRTATYMYDGNGTRTWIDFDLDDDGTIDRTAHLNADGRWERVERDVDDDGTIDRINHYTFDDDGNRSVTRIEFDDDDDGTIDRTATYMYDGNGTRTWIDFDLDDDGTIDRTAHLNADGRWERVERDVDDDGTIDRINHYTFDDDGNRSVTRRDFDLDGDGTIDRSEACIHDGDGNRTRIDFDDDADGTTDRTVHLNAAGRWERVERDVDDDGTIDRTVHRNTDGTGTLNRIDFDDDGDGTTDRSEFYTHNADSNRIRTDFDDDADGTIDRTETYTYDANGRVSRTGFDDDNDGTTDRTETYTYNSDGRVRRTDFDDDGDGTIDRSARALSSLDGTNGFILNGIDAGDQSGFFVSSAGDVNGDGYDDLIIGADGADPNGVSTAGETYVVHGGASAPGTGGVLDLSDLDGTNGFTLTGSARNDRVGFSVSSAGDVNGDGYDDLIIGADGAKAPDGGNLVGEIHVVYGGAIAPGTDGVLDLSDLDGSNGFTLSGVDAYDYSGRSVSSAGDVNGDGYDDLIIGALGADPNGGGSGETYLVYGGAIAPGTDGVLDLSDLDGSNGFTLSGVDAYDRSGTSVSSAGDVNGDGHDDLIIGATGVGSNAGATYVVYGGASAPGTDGEMDLSTLNGTNGFILNGIDADDLSGRSVSSAGDVNGDGYDDLIIGATGVGSNAGATYVVYGGAIAPGTDGVLDLSDLDGTNGFTLTGSARNDHSGFSVSSAGDVNGDGYDDLIIGANRADPNGSSSGETYLVYGGASAPGTDGELDLSALDGSNGFTLTGIDAYDLSGTSVSSAGDVNGDGYDDLIIGARYADPNGDTNAGETYIVYGGATGTESLVPVTASGTAAADNFTGNAGADSFTDIATNDVARGGAGDDTIRVTALDFAAIDGGTGQDTLVLDGAGLSLDLTGAGHAGVDSVEVLDLSGTGASTLVLDALAVFDLTEEREGGVASLDVRGDADDRVDLTQSMGRPFVLAGQATEDGVTYNVYRDGNAQARVEAGVRVQIPVSTLPVFTSPATASVAENQASAYMAAAADADGDRLRYSLSGTDAALFTIDANTGEVRFMAAPDFEAPGDDDGDNVHDITVTASDGTNSANHNVAITVTNENDNAPAFTSPATASVAENQASAYMAAAADADGDTLVYSLSGTDAGLFTIDANTGVVSFRAAPDFEAPGDSDRDNVHDIIVTASDGTNSTNHNVAITVTNENDNAPTFTSPAIASVAENQVAAYEAAATDADGDRLRYSLSGTDAGLFTIDANTGEVRFMAAPDFEAPGDADRDNVHDIIVTASDGTNSANHNVAITVTNENDNVPTFTSPATASVAENQASAYMAAATDADGDTLVYSLSGTDAALFTIDANTGEVRFMAAPDFEAPGDDDGDNVHDITVTASDGTNSANHNVAITVTNENDNAPTFTSPATTSVAENQVAAYEAAAADADGDRLRYSLSGTDAGLFTIDANTGEVRFMAAPDFEMPGDADRDNVHDIIITASDGTNSANHNVAITVTNENDNAPAFTSPAIASVAENQVAAYEAAATDADGDPLRYSLSGTDAALFTIDANTGEVRFMAAPDFEMPGDADRDNVHDIIITASDGTNSANHNVAITVTNENDNVPAFTSPATASVAENQASAYMAAAADADGDTLVYSLSGTDAALFTIDANTGEVRFMAAPDFEAPGDADRDNVHDIIVTASDGTNSANHNVAITVTNENDNAPTFTSPATASVAENQVAAYGAAATDADGDSLRYSLSGTDAALFTIDANTGEVRFMAAPDFEMPGDDDGDNVHDITVTASDGTNSANHNVAITVTNENDNAPTFTSPATASVAENQVAAYGAAATDADGDRLRYSLSGADAALFTIDANTGEVRFMAAPDFEMPGDDDGDNVHDITVTASDGTNSANHNVAITVTNENDNVPAFTSPATASVAENQASAYMAVAADADGDTLVYSLSGTDAALFTITPDTGEVRFMAAPDFEMPGDADRDNVHDIIITASDGTNSANHNVAITVTNENDNAPTFTSPAIASVAENQVAAYEAAATDADGDSLRYSLSGTDAALFTIDANTGEVRFMAAPDFEAPGDADRDNVHDIIITASDGDNSANHNVAITVTDEYDLIPLSSLDGSNGFILNGINANDQSGWSVSSAGDVNGDGYDDLIIGAYRADPNGDSNAGATYVVHGGASAPGTGGRFNLSSLDGSNGFTLTGIDAGDGSGRSVSSAGDVNGDGYDDLIIGAWSADPNGDSNAGETHVVHGGASAPGTDGVLDLGALDGTNGFILNGIDASDYSGGSVSSAGDVNGDGYDDLIIGAWGADPNGDSNAGETYVIHGGASAPGTDGVLNLGALDGTNGFILTGVDAGDFSGWSVSSAGDVNGDGYDDLIIGANGAGSNAGATYVVYGGANAPGTDGELDLSDLNGTNGFILTGMDAYDYSGWSVSSAGDVNGDGYDDLIIGAFRADPNGDNRAGETYVIHGGASAPGTGGVLDLGALDGTNGFTLTGIDAGDESGLSVSSAGDVNGDGYDDLIIGARGADPNGGGSGETYLVYGGASAPGTGGVLDLSDLDGTNGFTLTGIDEDDLSGASVSSAGDVNGDGYDDLIIGARYADPNGDTNAGETYIVYGGATGTESLVPVTAQGTAAADNFTGNAGADSFTDIATNDVVRGGAGDETISVTALDFAAIDGGTGRDTLVLDGAGLSLDLTGAGHAGVDSVEVLDLSGTGASTLVLDALAVFDLTEERAGGVASLDVRGGADDSVDLVGSPFALTGTVTEDGTAYTVYRDGNAQLRVEAGVQVSTLPVFTSPATASVAENQAAAYGAVATDADGDTLVYSLSGTDAGLFTITPDTGEVRFMAAPDFEMPGDDDGDNVYDIIVTASDGTNSTNHNVAITVTDENDLIPLSSLDGSNGFTLAGIDGGDYSGFSVSSAGDVNGDGYDDLIIGAWRADPNGDSYAGETYVIHGGARAPGTDGVLDLSSLNGTSGFILNGVDAFDRSGISVSSAGDVNGDGYDDLIIGAQGADPNGASNAGEAYVVHGGASAPGTGGRFNLSTLNGSNGFILNGIDRDDFSGASVSSAGDVNGDGYDDLIIGARYADPNGRNSGETHVVYGGASAPGTDGVLDLSDLDGSNGFTLKGIDAFDQSGISVSSAGDVNGDGYDDLIIGARYADPNGGTNVGETHVVYGGASAPGTGGRFNLSTLNGTNGFILNGVDASDYSGGSVSSAGDVNGDGYDDLIIGADGADDSAGETYVVYGGANAPETDGEMDLSALNGTNGFTLTGIDAGDRSGTSVSSAGDVNGDGYDDLIIGANRADPNGEILAGETYIVYGGASAPGTDGVLDLSDLDGSNGFTLTGIDPFDDSGISVSSAGDVNGDGYDDLIIGANRADPNGESQAGETYVLHGGATGTESLVPVTAQGTAVADNFTGNAGADSFTDIATNDVVRGGAGDDRIRITSLDFAAIDGGTGRDTLVLDGAGLSLDLTGAGHAGVDSVEVLDLSGTGASTLVLDALAVFDLTEERAGGVASLDVRGDADDRVDLGGSPFALTGTVTEDGTTYTVYRDGNAQVRVEAGVQVQIPPVVFSSLDGSNGFILNGVDAFDRSGISVSSAGDVNGDGYDDLIIGANTADPNGDSNAGETYVVHGGARAPGMDGVLDLSALNGTNGFILTGIDGSDFSGASVSSAGDVNGDGYDDLIIGAYRADPNGDSDAGETYLVYGGASAPGTGGVLDLSALNGTNGFILTGIDAFDLSGQSVSSAGDVNGDGYDDLIIGAHNANPNGDSSGETYVVYGGARAPGTDGVLDLSDLDGSNGFILNGIDAFDYSGVSVSSAGDVNGDGYDDLIIGAHNANPNGDNNAGETYIVHGGASAPGTGGVLDLSDLNGTNGFILTGIDANDSSGFSVSSAGDVNGDGYDDLIIGASLADSNGDNNAGETYVVYGGARAPGTGGVLDLSALDGTNGFILNGINAGDLSGFSVSSAGDVNGDGYDDLIIGARYADPNGSSSGETYIVHGGASAPGTGGVLDLGALDGTNGFILAGIDAGDNAGFSVSSAGDVNGDGYDDLIIGAYWADPNGDSDAGETYVLYGGATGTESLVPVTAQGTAAADNFTGNAGADSFTGIATNDVVRGGAGDETISVTALDFAAIDGGTGRDTLVLDGAGLSLDLTGAGHAGVDSVEVLDLSGTGASTLVLDALAVFDLTEERAGGVASLDVRGGADDSVDLVGSPFALTGTVTEDGTTYTVYRDGNAQVRVEAGVQVSTLPVFTSPATASVAENQAAAYGAVATDADGDTLVYSLSGTDAALFTINANTGEVRFMAAPDFEMPGDDDGDNVYDIIITASDGDNSTNHNVAITVTDENHLIPLSSLDGSNGFTLTGIDAGDGSGRSVSSAGDVNGDGYDDLIIGARYGDPNGDSSAGETYVIHGGARAPGTDGVLDLSDLDGTNGFILNGVDAFDRSGISVSSAGDVNGDGYDDLIIGANTADPNGDSNAGETYVVHGGARAPGTDGVLDLSALNGTNGFILTGIDGSDFSGASVSSAGDVNGDGYDDLIIGAYRADPNGDSDAGETYLVYGGASAPGTGGVLDLSALNGTNGFILTGIDAFDLSGQSVSSAGDVNGDGYDDLIIGARSADPNGRNSGETYLVYGGASAPGTGGVLDLSALNGTNGFILNGIDAFDYSGVSVSSAGDVNGDGYDDLIIGAHNADPNGDSNAGETYVVHGGANAPGTDGVLDLSALDGTNGFILTGIDAGDESGRSVSSAGDVNGDGYDDLIIGAWAADPNGSSSGETYLVYGGASAPGTGGELDLSDLDVTNGFTLNGIDEDDHSGFSVSSAGDVNGDGYDDLIIGAYRADGFAGETYVLHGGATGTESLVPVTAQGTAAADNFTGNAGADSFTGIATNDVVRGGAGDDTIRVTALDFAAIDGGTGQDTLVLDGAGLSLDLTGAGHAGVDSIEVLDLSGTGASTLVLDALAVFDLTEERAGGVASLDVRGDADDSVDPGGSPFALTGTVTEDGTTYNVYRDGNAQLRVEDGVSVTLAGSMGTGTGLGANGDGSPERIGDRDASGLSVRLDEDTDGDGDTDRVTYGGDTDFAGNFPNNIGLEVVRLDGLDGEGGTDLTIPDEFVFAGNPSGNRVRIEGGSTDTLRFDMDDFTEAPEAVGFGGESYRGFAPDDQAWSFLVDADVMLFDI